MRSLTEADVYVLLVGERGWTLDELERWTAELLVARLHRS
jgi:hypothetical protein